MIKIEEEKKDNLITKKAVAFDIYYKCKTLRAGLIAVTACSIFAGLPSKVGVVAGAIGAIIACVYLVMIQKYMGYLNKEYKIDLNELRKQIDLQERINNNAR